MSKPVWYAEKPLPHPWQLLFYRTCCLLFLLCYVYYFGFRAYRTVTWTNFYHMVFLAVEWVSSASVLILVMMRVRRPWGPKWSVINSPIDDKANDALFSSILPSAVRPNSKPKDEDEYSSSEELEDDRGSLESISDMYDKLEKETSVSLPQSWAFGSEAANAAAADDPYVPPYAQGLDYAAAVDLYAVQNAYENGAYAEDEKEHSTFHEYPSVHDGSGDMNDDGYGGARQDSYDQSPEDHSPLHSRPPRSQGHARRHSQGEDQRAGAGHRSGTAIDPSSTMHDDPAVAAARAVAADTAKRPAVKAGKPGARAGGKKATLPGRAPASAGPVGASRPVTKFRPGPPPVLGGAGIKVPSKQSPRKPAGPAGAGKGKKGTGSDTAMAVWNELTKPAEKVARKTKKQQAQEQGVSYQSAFEKQKDFAAAKHRERMEMLGIWNDGDDPHKKRLSCIGAYLRYEARQPSANDPWDLPIGFSDLARFHEWPVELQRLMRNALRPQAGRIRDMPDEDEPEPYPRAQLPPVQGAGNHRRRASEDRAQAVYREAAGQGPQYPEDVMSMRSNVDDDDESMYHARSGEHSLLMDATAGEGDLLVPHVDELKWRVHILIPCYSEPLAVVALTVKAALSIDYPPHLLNVYLLDDGKDPQKAEWVRGVRHTLAMQARKDMVAVQGVHRAVNSPHGPNGGGMSGFSDHPGTPTGMGYPGAGSTAGLDYENAGTGLGLDLGGASMVGGGAAGAGAGAHYRSVPKLVYEARRKIPGRPHHGKAGNVNHCMRRIIYPHKQRPPPTDMIVIFDADMVCSPDFLKETVPYHHADAELQEREPGKHPRLAMVQTPQWFYNLSPTADMWNHNNVLFFQYMLPGMDSWNATSCCGTNMLISAQALHEVGWVPIGCVTEDALLSMRLLAAGFRLYYHEQNLVLGQAPDDLRMIFQQRSRWAKGSLQILAKENPLKQQGLSWSQRLFYFDNPFSYIVTAVCYPFFLLIPLLAILFQIYPVNSVDLWFSVSYLAYYMLLKLAVSFTPSFTHDRAVWVSDVMNVAFMYTFQKAIVSVIMERYKLKTLTFKVTEKSEKDAKAGGGTSGGAGGGGDLKSPRSSGGGSEVALAVRNAQSPSQSALISPRSSTATGGGDQAGKKQKKPQPVEPEEEPQRDTNRKDIYFHVVCLGIHLLVLAYGIYRVATDKRAEVEAVFHITGDRSPFGDDLSKVTAATSGALYVLSLLWLTVNTAPFLLPVLYAYLPHDPRTHSAAISRARAFYLIIVLLLLIFPVAFLAIKEGGRTAVLTYSPDTLPTNPRAFWLTSVDSDFSLKDYLKKSYESRLTPLLVLQLRRGNLNTPTTWAGYRKELDRLATSLLSKIPCVIVYEPGWIKGIMIEKLSKPINQTDLPIWVEEIRHFTDMVPSSYVYADVNSPQWIYGQAGQFFFELQKYWPTFEDFPKIRGWSVNVGSFYTVSYTHYAMISFGYNQRGLYNVSNNPDFTKPNFHPPRYIIDTSRNGGRFSANPAGIAACEFDPPGLGEGPKPAWLAVQAGSEGGVVLDPRIDEVFLTAGLEAVFWVKTFGESDGRLFPAGEFRACLKNHNVPCQPSCPNAYRPPDAFRNCTC